MIRILAIGILLIGAGCLGGASSQSFSYTIETFDKTGMMETRERVRGKNLTFAGPTRATAMADRSLVINIDTGKDSLLVEMGERVDIKGGELTPEQIRAVSSLVRLPGVP